jgi:hypothetical protein
MNHGVSHTPILCASAISTSALKRAQRLRRTRRKNRQATNQPDDKREADTGTQSQQHCGHVRQPFELENLHNDIPSRTKTKDQRDTGNNGAQPRICARVAPKTLSITAS